MLSSEARAISVVSTEEKRLQRWFGDVWVPIPLRTRNEVLVPCILNGWELPIRLNPWSHHAQLAMIENGPGFAPAQMGPSLRIGVDPVARSAETLVLEVVAPLGMLAPNGIPEGKDPSELYQLRTKIDLHKPLKVFDGDQNIVERPIGQFDRADLADAINISLWLMAEQQSSRRGIQFSTNFVIDSTVLRKTFDYLGEMSPQLRGIITESAARDELEYMLHAHRGVIALIVESSFTQGAARGNLDGSLEAFLMDIRNGEYETWESLLKGSSSVPVIMKEEVYSVLGKLARMFSKDGATSDEVADNWIRKTGSLNDRLSALGPQGVMLMVEVIHKVAEAQIHVAQARGSTALMEAAAVVTDARLQYFLIASGAATHIVGTTTGGIAGVIYRGLKGLGEGFSNAARGARRSLGAPRPANSLRALNSGDDEVIDGEFR